MSFKRENNSTRHLQTNPNTPAQTHQKHFLITIFNPLIIDAYCHCLLVGQYHRTHTCANVHVHRGHPNQHSTHTHSNKNSRNMCNGVSSAATGTKPVRSLTSVSAGVSRAGNYISLMTVCIKMALTPNRRPLRSVGSYHPPSDATKAAHKPTMLFHVCAWVLLLRQRAPYERN